MLNMKLWQMATCNFFNPTDATRVASSPRLGVGPGFDSQGSVNFFNKYCFPNKALEVEDCEFVPVHHQQCDTFDEKTCFLYCLN